MKGRSFLHLLRLIFKLDLPDTQTTPPERDALAKYAAGAGLAVEIGVFEGVNTVIIGKALANGGRLFGIDPFFKGRLGICYHKIIAELHLKRNGVTESVEIIEKLSFDAVGDLPATVDFIFIDGDHSYEGIHKDWQLYANLLKAGGIMALHDTSIIAADGDWVQGSVRYYNDVIKHDNRFEWIATVDRMNILRRKSEID
jgi:predicted O-methyltransferase YrrM